MFIVYSIGGIFIMDDKMRDDEEKIEEQIKDRGMYKDYGSYYEKPEDKTGEGYGIASLVFGCIAILGVCFLPIVGMIPSILAIIFGVLGLKAINRGLAIAGLSLGIVTLLPQLFLFILFISRGFTYSTRW